MKEFLYIGRYNDTCGNIILKIGTTNNLDRRQKEHTRSYRKSKTHTMPENESFEYIFSLALSKYNTLRFEDKNRQSWIDNNIGEFVRNDRFVISADLTEVVLKIRKEYHIPLN